MSEPVRFPPLPPAERISVQVGPGHEAFVFAHTPDAMRSYGEACVALNSGPAMSLDDYNARAIPRLAAIDALSAKIDFTSFAWRNTPEGERWQRLMVEQGRDEAAAGI
jgi:hypothetical protein